MGIVILPIAVGGLGEYSLISGPFLTRQRQGNCPESGLVFGSCIVGYGCASAAEGRTLGTVNWGKLALYVHRLLLVPLTLSLVLLSTTIDRPN